MLSNLIHGEVKEGEQNCFECKKAFNWKYLYRDPKSREVFIFPTIPEDTSGLTLLDEKTGDAKAYCPHCGRMNFFNVKF